MGKNLSSLKKQTVITLSIPTLHAPILPTRAEGTHVTTCKDL
ncbi:MAG: hypothetical protein PVF83_03830 [Anaerolineales bacterium]